jgi:hypothetical protein
MTHTETPTVEFSVCQDCAIVLANGDTSGLINPEDHLAAMDHGLATVTDVIVVGNADTGFRTDECGACGIWTATDSWFAVTATAR